MRRDHKAAPAKIQRTLADPAARKRYGKRFNLFDDGRGLVVLRKDTQLIIEVQPGGDEGFANLCRASALDPSEWPRAFADSGACYYYLSKPSDVPVLESLPGDQYAGVSFPGMVPAAGSSGVCWDEIAPSIVKGLPKCPRKLLKVIEDDGGAWINGGVPMVKPDEVPAEEPRYAVLDGWQFIVESYQFIHNDGAQIWSDKQFGMKFGHLSPKGDLIAKIRQGKIPMTKYDRQVYIPKGAPIVPHEGADAFNLWRPSAMTPKAGDHQWFLDHIAYMFPDAKAQSHVLDFMAQLIQFPEVKIHFALLIVSKQGVGKGALAMILRKMIGKRNTVEPSNDEVTKTYTGWQEGAQLAIINELMAGGSASVLNRLKSPITEDTLRIEKKFGNAFSIPNHMNMFAMTNHKDALPIPADDRRWLVLFSTAAKRAAEYYDALFANIADDSKVAAAMQYLLDRFITFNPKGPAPMTEAKRDMADRSKTDVAILLQDMLDERADPFGFDLVRMSDIVAAIRARQPNEKNINKIVAAFLDDIGALKLARDTNTAGAFQLYAVRDHAKWKAMGRAEALAAFKATLADDLDE